MIKVLQADLKQAMKDKDTIKRNLLQVVISKVNSVAKDKKVDMLPENEEIAVIQSVLKQNNESLEAFKKGGRADLVAQATREIEILMTYLPKQLTENEITEIVKNVISRVVPNATSQDKGKVMKAVMPELKGKADGKLVDKIVTSLLK